MSRPALRWALAAVLAAPAWLTTAGAQTAVTDLQGQVPPPAVPMPADPAALPSLPATPKAQPARADGTRVTLRAVRLEGNDSVPADRLLAELGPLEGRSFTLTELEALAEQLTAHYRRLGFPLARAVLPPQRIEDGTLLVRVVEGRFGRIEVAGDDPKAPGARPFLAAELASGGAVRSDVLERPLLLIDDQPGFRARPVLRPGTQAGETDLVVAVERRNRYSGDVAIDNTGNVSTGEYRLRGTLNVNSPFTFGDKLSLSGMVTDESLKLGSIDYERPLDATGTRAGIGWARTSYLLGGAFAALDNRGMADIASLRLSRALLRSQRVNVGASLTLQHKSLDQHDGSTGTDRARTSRVAIAGLQFDRRDRLGGGGVTYGQVSFTSGSLSLDEASRTLDDGTARTAGGFSKANADVARIQRLDDAWSVYGRVSAQWASKNLDASEKLAPGGFLGVRAYPLGEGSGDSGWLAQTELRRGIGSATAFAFFDAARTRLNQAPWAATGEDTRSLAGAGLGARWLQGGWTLESTVGWRTQGGTPQAEPRDRVPRVFVVLSHRFD